MPMPSQEVGPGLAGISWAIEQVACSFLSPEVSLTLGLALVKVFLSFCFCVL